MEGFFTAFKNLIGPDMSLIGGSWAAMYGEFLFVLAILAGHFTRKIRALPLWMVVAPLFPFAFIAVSMIALELTSWKSHVLEIWFYILAYSVFVFVGISEWLMRGGANRLTARRGDKWPKEIDYLYLSIGALGVALSLAQSPFSAERITAPHISSMILLVTALVLRVIKTRAEVNDWHKAGRNNDEEGDKYATPRAPVPPPPDPA